MLNVTHEFSRPYSRRLINKQLLKPKQLFVKKLVEFQRVEGNINHNSFRGSAKVGQKRN